MSEPDHKQIANLGKTPDHEADRVLNAELSKYASVEPRSGLEARILANLRVAKTRTPEHAWRRLSLAAAAIAVLVVAMFFSWRPGKPTHPVHATVKPSPQSRGTQLVLNNGGRQVRRNRIVPPRHLSQRPAAYRPRPGNVAAAIPKLDRFPSPRPLSEQEKMLRSYVSEDSEQAVLIARARSEALRRDELEEMKISLVDHDGDSGQGKNDTTER